MEKIVLTYKEFLDKVRKLRQAKDENGNAFYSDAEIAMCFGYSTTSELNQMIVRATTGYRKETIVKVKRMMEAGCDLDEIGDKLRLDQSTIHTLLDDLNENIEKTQKAENERIQSFQKLMGDSQKVFDTLNWPKL